MAIEKSLEELAALLGGKVQGGASVMIRDVAPIDSAGPGEVTFLGDQKNLRLLKATRASAVLVKEGRYEGAGPAFILVKNPHAAFARLIDLFRPAHRPAPGVDPRALVHAGARLGASVTVQAFTVVEEGATVGDRAVLYPGVYVGRNSVVGDDSILYPGVKVREDCRIGKRVIIHSNSVVGSDGFGYVKEGARHVKVPQRGVVRVEDDVEIGACVTIDRATIGETVIGRGTKIDNLVQIAHNVRVGEDTVIVAQVGIAGSATIGSRVQLGGQAGVIGHIEIGDDSAVGAKSGVTGSVPPGTIVSGIPAIPHGEWLRAASLYGKLPELKKKITELEKRLEAMERGAEGGDKLD